MEVMSKNMTIRRRSLYLTSPGLDGRDLVGGERLHGGRVGLLGVAAACGCGRGASAGSGSGLLFQSLELEDLDVLRLAVFGDGEVLAVRPSIGLPLLSFTVTSTTTSWTRGFRT